MWDHFLVYGWKSIFKISILILKHNEESMLDMQFEMLVAQMMSLPYKFLVAGCISVNDEYEKKEKAL